ALDDEYIGNLYQSSPLHDIGKVGVPDHILLKPGKLTKEEFEIMKTHTSIGGDALASSERMFGDNSFLSMGRDIAYYHHEKWNGAGYPKGLKGEEIPLPARIMSIADIYDALTSKRIYKDAFPHERTVSMIMEESGKMLDPNIVKAFSNVQDVFQEIRANIDEIK
ncbi:MAG: HD domain-containing protein, partial [Nitrospinota bacterium]|nr:HD domain-containing protein [Nitrospinota bacterium]